MKGIFIVVLAVAISLSLTLTTQTAFAATITLVNPSFEDPLLDDGDFTRDSIPGWDIFNGAAGVFDPSPTFYANPNYTLESIIPDGENVAYSNGGDFCQDLSDTLQLNTIYTLEVKVGQRDDTALGGYAIHFRAFDTDQETLAGVDSAGDDGLPIPTQPGRNSFVTNTVTYETGDSHPRAGQQLRICIIGDGLQSNFDTVSLDASPSDDGGTGQNGLVAVGGDFIPLDTTMVLVAGAQYTAAWMIPAIVSAIGIGIVIARKF